MNLICISRRLTQVSLKRHWIHCTGSSKHLVLFILNRYIIWQSVIVLVIEGLRVHISVTALNTNQSINQSINQLINHISENDENIIIIYVE